MELLKKEHLGQSTEEWTKSSFWKTAIRKFQVVWSAEVDHMTSNFLKAVSTKFYFDPFICLKKPFPKE